MLQGLAHHRTDVRIVELRSSAHDLRNQVVPPATGEASASRPAPDLAFVIRRSPALEITAVPLEPAVRVLRNDPPAGLPHLEASSALHSVAVLSLAVSRAGHLGFYGQAFQPIRGQL